MNNIFHQHYSFGIIGACSQVCCLIYQHINGVRHLGLLRITFILKGNGNATPVPVPDAALVPGVIRVLILLLILINSANMFNLRTFSTLLNLEHKHPRGCQRNQAMISISFIFLRRSKTLVIIHQTVNKNLTNWDASGLVREVPLVATRWRQTHVTSCCSQTHQKRDWVWFFPNLVCILCKTSTNPEATPLNLSTCVFDKFMLTAQIKRIVYMSEFSWKDFQIKIRKAGFCLVMCKRIVEMHQQPHLCPDDWCSIFVNFQRLKWGDCCVFPW